MQRKAWLLGFFLGAPVLLLSTLTLLISSQPRHLATPFPSVLAASDSQEDGFVGLPEIAMSVNSSDARPIIIKNYLSRYRSPLAPYASLIVEVSDKYSLDYRLLPAIAQQESNLCKRIPPDSHNCWGYGIYGNLVTRFDSYSQAIETVARGLKKNYLDKGLDTPEKIMAKYTPPSLEKGGPWAKGVNQFLSDLE